MVKHLTKTSKTRESGYTIIEVMIFLVVSAAMFGTAYTMVNEQNRRTAFTQSVQEFDQQIRDTLNDVETGYYPTLNNIVCSAATTPISFSPGSAPQGTNQDCIFIGKAIEFNGNSFEIFTVAGKRIVSSGREVSNLSEAGVRAVTHVKDSGSLSAQVEVTKIVPGSDCGGGTYAFAVVSSFGQTSGNVLQPGIATNSRLATLNSCVDNLGRITLTESNLSDARAGLLICLQEPGGGRQATVLVGGNAQEATSVTIDSNDSRCN